MKSRETKLAEATAEARDIVFHIIVLVNREEAGNLTPYNAARLAKLRARLRELMEGKL